MANLGVNNTPNLLVLVELAIDTDLPPKCLEMILSFLWISYFMNNFIYTQPLAIKVISAQGFIHPHSCIMECFQFERSLQNNCWKLVKKIMIIKIYLIVGNCCDQSITVKMKINVNQMGKQPLWFPTIFLRTFHF